MTRGDVARLVLLAAIWGASFLFMRISAPVLGAILTAEIRLIISALALVAYFAVIGVRLEWREHWWSYTIVGAVNSGIPFLLYSYAALTLPASYSVVLNATSPFFGVLLSALWLREPVTARRMAGVTLGILGVALVARLGPIALDAQAALAGIACLVAAACYAIAGIYIKRSVRQTNPLATAGASQIGGAMVIALALPWAGASGPVTWPVAASVVALAIICSAVAYLIYFRLIARIGPAKALTVTFLSPVFGIVWGALFLGEAISAPMLAGCALVISGTALVLLAPSSASR